MIVAIAEAQRKLSVRQEQIARFIIGFHISARLSCSPTYTNSSLLHPLKNSRDLSSLRHHRSAVTCGVVAIGDRYRTGWRSIGSPREPALAVVGVGDRARRAAVHREGVRQRHRLRSA